MSDILVELIGKTLTRFEKDNADVIVFHFSDGTKYRMYHEQDCCEDVEIKEIHGDLNGLVGDPIVMFEESTEEDKDGPDDECLWTFYKIATVNETVTIRWYGSSNGYYSVGVDFEQIEVEKEIKCQ